MSTKIEWCEETWNPIIGCSKVSPGCDNCYAERMAKRLCAMGQESYFPVVNPNGWTGETELVESALEKPLHWKKPRTIFVCSMGDLFHKTVLFNDILEVMFIINKCPQHTFLILTKRPERMREFFQDWVPNPFWINGDYLPNVWLGVTAENQRRADERIPILLQIPAAKRFVSIEPMLGPIFFPQSWVDEARYFELGVLHWVICGGESGPGARPMHPDWVRSIRDQCQGAGVPFFFKQWGEWVPVDYINKEKPNKSYVNLTPDGKKEILLREPSLVNLRRIGKKKAGSLLHGKELKQLPI